MKKILATLLLLVVGVAYAAPISNFTATAPTQYEDGNTIPISDVLSYRLYCGNTSGGPYNTTYDIVDISAFTQDVATCVGGTPGTYYFVATALSSEFTTESVFSNETSKLYTAQDLGKVPLAPTLLQVQ